MRNLIIILKKINSSILWKLVILKITKVFPLVIKIYKS